MSKSVDFQKLIIVVGLPRSGTTLLQRILGTHPKIYAGPEFDYLGKLAKMYQQMKGAIERGRINEWLNVDELTLYFRELIFQLLFTKARKLKREYVSEKTPLNVLHLEEIYQLLPDANYIVILRNPYDIARSMLEVGMRIGIHVGFTSDIFAASRFISTSMKKIENLFGNNHEKYLIITYEELIKNPVETSNKIFKKIGLNEVQEINLNNTTFREPLDYNSWKNWYTKEQIKASNIYKNQNRDFELKFYHKLIIRYMINHSKFYKMYYKELTFNDKYHIGLLFVIISFIYYVITRMFLFVKKYLIILKNNLRLIFKK